MKRNLFKLICLGFSAFVSTSTFAADCPSGNIATSSALTCTKAADSFGVTLYEIGLCSSTPTVPATGAAYSTSNCQVIYTNSSGAQVSAGATQTLTGGTSQIPQAGTYNYGYAVFKNEISVQGSATFATTVNSRGTSVTSGTTCVTTATAVSVSAISPSMSTVPYACNTGATQGAMTVTVDTLATNGSFLATKHYTSSDYAALGSDSLDVYLIDTSNQLSASGSVRKMMGIQQFASPVVINSSSSSLDVGFTKSTALSVIVTPTGGTPSVLLVPAIPNVKISGH